MVDGYSDAEAAIRDPERLAALHRTLLLDTPSEEAFDRLARLALSLLRAPVALISLLDAERQFFKSYVAQPPRPLDGGRDTALSHSFCRHVVARRRPLLVGDARTDSLVADNPAVSEQGVVAYAGIPLITSDGHALGSFCVFDTEPRQWREDEVTNLTDLASAAMTEIELRLALRDAASMKSRLAEQRAEQRSAFLAEASKALASSLDYNMTLQTVAHLTVPALADLCVVDMVEEGGAIRRLAVAAADPAKEALAGQLKARYPVDARRVRGVPEVLRTGEPVVHATVTPDLLAAVAQDGAHLAVLRALDFHTAMLVPLKAHGQTLGVMTFVRGAAGEPYGPGDLSLAEDLAGRCVLAIENARLYGAEQLARRRLRALSRRLVEVQEAERRHIARELHDELGQTLTGVKLLLEMASRGAVAATAVRDGAAPPGHPTGGATNGRSKPGDAPLVRAQALIGDVMTWVRAFSLELRPAILDDLGLLPALLWHLERYREQTGVELTFQHAGIDRRFPPDVETAAYRIVQEALTNVARHAGVAQASASLWSNQDGLFVRVEDAGRGFDPAAVMNCGTSGLAGMRERAELLGGNLTIESVPGEWTRVTATLPLTHE